MATDGSEYSRKAIEKCCQSIVSPDDTEIKVISVYQRVFPLDTFMQSAEYSEQLEIAALKTAEENADKAAAQIREYFPNINLTAEAKSGAPYQVIIEEAETWQADLIVVGSHGNGFWGRALLGSVSDSVVHHAPCSVLVVRNNE